jgi:RHH-type proline utilization regulon transcriptional repressor/proline dehydrogenase/delta 1-pyrroline-5-carboxylate dehydrogenase
VLCISPWNFPLAIFMGQVAAALAAGNAVIAKPAEQTSLIAAEAIRILHAAGVPGGVVQLLPGTGETVGAVLVARPEINGVMFTGSTAVAHHISTTLAGRLSRDGTTVPLIAETGGQNAMVVDSSALAEQVVYDVLTSAFDSAGQRCSALRVLCVQDDCADRLLEMLRGAMHELRIGNPDRLSTDVGPVIDGEAAASIDDHIRKMREAGMRVLQLPLPPETQHGTFVPPTLIEIDDIGRLEREVFGPVLHVLRYRRDDLGKVLDAVNATGYGLTFGLHTRIDETVRQVISRVRAGNIYVNRNIVGAVVGVQPFGGEGLSGTGPKAGGPLYLYRLLSTRPPTLAGGIDLSNGLPATLPLPGPTGETNEYHLHPRGTVLCIACSDAGFRAQLDAVLRTGNRALFTDGGNLRDYLAGAEGAALDRIDVIAADRIGDAAFDAVLFEGDGDALLALSRQLAAREGPIVPVQGLTPDSIAHGARYALEPLLLERAVSINTAAAGGNATLMTIG